MFLSFTRPRAELTRRYLPSKSNQTGVTCGLPFDMTVARLANAFFVVTRSWNSGGIVATRCGGAGLREGDDANQAHPCANSVSKARAARCRAVRRVRSGSE